jgi:hypothetical protein
MRVEHQQGELTFNWRDPLHNTPLAGLSCIAAGERLQLGRGQTAQAAE